MEPTHLRRMPIHVSFPRLEDSGRLVNEQQVHAVILQWVRAHQLSQCNLHVWEDVFTQLLGGQQINVPGFMIVGHILTTEEKALPQMRDLGLRLCTTSDCKVVFVMFGAHEEKVLRPAPQQGPPAQTITKPGEEPQHSGKTLPGEKSSAVSSELAPNPAKKLH